MIDQRSGDQPKSLPASIRRAFNRFRAFFLKRPLDCDLNEELEAHLGFAIEENVRRGMSAEEARRQAMIRFGGVMQAKELQREARGLPGLDILMQDLIFTLRTLRREHSFTIIAVLILALGIGANIAVFSVVNTILLRPLPFRDPQQLLWMAPAASKCGFSCETYTADAYEEFSEQNHAFQNVAGYFAFSSSDNVKLTGHGQPKPATSIMVTGNFFQMLGIEPTMGRLFEEDETRIGARPVTLLSNAFWRSQYAADPSIVGKAIDMDGTPVTVVGVLPENFDFGSVFSPGAKVDLFTPVILDQIRPWGNTLALVGRIKPSVTVAQAQADANIVTPRLYFSPKYPESLGAYKDRPMKLMTLKEYVSGKLRPPLIVLWCAVGAILLIVCVNLANLMLARAATRTKEFALRLALGAGRIRLLRQLLTESMVLSGAGAVLGLALAFGITYFLAHQGSIALPMLNSVRVDGAVLAWTVGIAVFAAVLFGSVPGLKVSRNNVQEALKDSGPGVSEGTKHERMRSLLVISEVALACVLLVGAGLLLRSFLRVLDVDLGFEPSHAAAIKVDYDGSTPEKVSVIFQQILAEVGAIPGVERAGIVDYLPLERNRSWGSPQIKGKHYAPGELPGAFVYMITPGYFQAMGMRLHGRDFTWADDPKGEQVIVVNQTVARALFPNQDAIGRMVFMNGMDLRIVGVIDDVHEANVEGKPGWQVYFSSLQQKPVGAELVVRTKLPPETLAASVMTKLRQLNPNQPAAEFRMIQTIVDHAVSPRRFFVLLVVSFAVFGVILAALGIYGVISYSVTQRTQEIGIRMALGASVGRVQLGVVGKTIRLALIGIAAGTAASVGVAKGIAALLFGTAPTDPATFGGMILVLGLVALIAGYLPARRASRIDPMVALRNN
ncbi:ABC transporter permease [Acidicapsa acidisoli]|uniref:ABC transporter permease n=1 Tax=Acidicapsa acidisoli TaxID=1615681 RepID=UPI0021DF6701|nr:ABC transporter permease [Acidicapsa acidisoli]